MLQQTHCALFIDAFDQGRVNSDGEHRHVDDEGGEMH